MISIQFSEYGSPAGLYLAETPPQSLGPNQVRVAIEAAPLNPSDFLLIEGHYPFRPALPSPAGSEGVGRVVEVGSEVTSVALGERVLVLPAEQPGTWQEQVVADERLVVRVSLDSDPHQLATVGINAATAVLVLRYGRDLPEGTWIAQTAANSGLADFIRALAHKQGLRVLDVVRRADAAAALRETGSDAVVVSDEDYAANVAEALGDSKLPLVLDGVGGQAVNDLVPFMAKEANVVSYAFLSGSPVAVPPVPHIFKNLHVHGFWLNNWLDSATREEIETVYKQIDELIADGTLSTTIEAAYPLEEYEEAVRHARRPGRSGKIVFSPTGVGVSR
ncbi:zinc-dependent alcohol dehydrogenase family protein [Streptomyces galbus]|uniref:enoyl-[acyl-carrier-protein] reductase n=1 Tax=Streptomyces galbus TaxID=33898 RepID=A0A4U5X112_STRGB|nr:zinc-dependent alcohol dehydrogenase family protein [Streptomyces galbus]TKT08022.1 zinc-dependent alcohol dehydrogenase family protein [Streptomyces galbus]GHD42290.1 alcohol dehydrogenase [Streptomyces galbus]